MNKIPLKTLRDGFSMPQFGMGTWMMGGGVKRDENDDGENAIVALRYGLTAGLSAIDSAEMYAEGFSETLVGRALEGIDRDSVFLSTKVWIDHLKFDDVLRAAENSLKRLKTDHIDLYMIHKPNDAVPLRDTIRAFNRLMDEKVIRNMGVSNFSIPRFEGAQAYADYKIAVNQVHFNLAYREPERCGWLDYAQAHDVMLIAWRPLQKGAILENGATILNELSRKYRKTPAQIALNWVMSHPNVVTLSTMRTPEHIDENLDSCNWTLDPDDCLYLKEHFPNQQAVSDAVPLS